MSDTVFITHSRHDAPILQHIQSLVAQAGVQPVFYQYDRNHAAPAWQEIREWIRNSQALFVVLSSNLGSSPHTQNWVGFEVGIAGAFGKPTFVFEEAYRRVLFPIPYFTDYVPYDLTNPQLRDLITGVARGYEYSRQRSAMVAGGAVGLLLFGPAAVIPGAVLGAVANQPATQPFVNLMCYHLDCKTRFRMYVWLPEFECPACRRIRRFVSEARTNGQRAIYPSPIASDLVHPWYAWFGNNGSIELVPR